MSDPTLVTVSRPEAYRLLGDYLEASHEMITACGYTPVGQELTPTVNDSIYVKLAKYLGPFFFMVDASHTQARSILRVRGIDCTDHIGGGFAAGSMVTARFLDKSLKALCSPESIEVFGTPNIESTRGVMHRSLETLQPFTQTSNSMNMVLEQMYGIKTSSLSVYEDHHGPYVANFSVAKNDNGEPNIVADNWEESCMRATYAEDPITAHVRLFDNNSGCPARKIFLPKFYHWAVDFSCNTADIVEAELDRQLSASSY